MLVIMPNQSRRVQRGIFLTEAQNEALERRKIETDAPASSQIRRAIENYLAMPHSVQHRLLTGPLEVRKPTFISDDLWDALKARKAETGLDLNEQVQIAVALYLEAESGAQPSPSQSPSPNSGAVIEVPPAEPIDRNALRQTLREELEAMGIKTYAAIPALMQVTRQFPVQAVVSCGNGDDLDNIVEPYENGATEEVTGQLAAIATAHSFIVLAKGWSMSDGETAFDIRPGDKLMMTPLDEFPRAVKKGDIVLAEVEFKDGRKVRTLKAYDGKRLKANNPEFQGVGLGPKIKTARVVAVCRGALERIYG